MTDADYHDPDICGEFRCKMRWWREVSPMNLSPKATPNRVRGREQPFRPPEDPSWESGKAIREHLPDGSSKPWLDPQTLEPMPIKPAGEMSKSIDAWDHKLRNDPNPFKE